ncbi:hypothetical protein GYMLUDRAFT_206258, partial [Collybiopsis luxurians FD-317 M1]
MSAVFGPFFWGFVVSIFLGGITIVQAYLYFPHPTDRMSVQAVAATMLILDLFSSGLVAQSLYYYLIPHFGSIQPLQQITPELSGECMISGVLTLISQMYFVYQIYTVKRKGRLAWIIVVVQVMYLLNSILLIVTCGVLGCVTSMFVLPHGVLADRSGAFAISFGLAKGFGAITDIMATIAMCAFLSNAKTGMEQTDTLVKNLIQFIIERGALVTLVQILVLITFYVAPGRLYWFAFHMNVTRLYANTFFCMLNARKVLWERYGPNGRAIIS